MLKKICEPNLTKKIYEITLTSTKIPIELLFLGISTLTVLFFTYSTVVLVDLNCPWLVWDLDMCTKEELEECWSTDNSTLVSTELLSSCFSALSTGVFFLCFTVLLADLTSPLLMRDLDICEKEEMEEIEEFWSAVLILFCPSRANSLPSISDNLSSKYPMMTTG